MSVPARRSPRTVNIFRSVFTWICRRLSRRYDSRVTLALPEAWRETQPPPFERFMRGVFGAPFSDEFTPKSFFWRWVARILFFAVYLFFLWLLYESLWAWDIFGGS